MNNNTTIIWTKDRKVHLCGVMVQLMIIIREWWINLHWTIELERIDFYSFLGLALKETPGAYLRDCQVKIELANKEILKLQWNNNARRTHPIYDVNLIPSKQKLCTNGLIISPYNSPNRSLMTIIHQLRYTVFIGSWKGACINLYLELFCLELPLTTDRQLIGREVTLPLPINHRANVIAWCVILLIKLATTWTCLVVSPRNDIDPIPRGVCGKRSQWTRTQTRTYLLQCYCS